MISKLGGLFEEAILEQDTNDEEGQRIKEEGLEALNSKREVKAS